MNKREFIDFFKYPNAVMSSCFGAAGLTLLGGSIASIALDVWAVRVRIIVMILMTLVLLYALYGLALALRLPEKAEALAKKSKFLAKFISSYGFRAGIFTLGSILFDLVFASLQLYIGTETDMNWYIANGGYYFLMGAIRLTVLFVGVYEIMRPDISLTERKNRSTKLFILTGFALLFMNGALDGLTYAMLYSGKSFAKQYDVVVYGTAIYAFYKLAIAIKNMIGLKKHRTLLLRALRNLSIISALVTMLSFQVTLIATFPNARDFSVANGIMASIITLTTAGLAISMIVRGLIARKKLKAELRKETSAAKPLFDK